MFGGTRENLSLLLEVEITQDLHSGENTFLCFIIIYLLPKRRALSRSGTTVYILEAISSPESTLGK